MAHPRTGLSPRAWRGIVAALSGAVTVACTLGGLFAGGATLQAGLLGGAAVGLVAAGIGDAAVAALAAGLLAVAAAPLDAWTGRPWDFAAVAVVALTCILAAVGVRALAARYRQAGPVVLWVALGLIVANMWVSAFTVDSQWSFDPGAGRELPPLFQRIDTPHAGLPGVVGDDALYVDVTRRVRSGQGFYDALDEQWRADRESALSEVYNYRLPTLFLFWSLLPDNRSAVTAYLVLASLAVAALPSLHKGSTPLPLVLPAAAALTVPFLYVAMRTVVMYTEPWAGAIAVLSLAAAARAASSASWRRFVVASVALALLATLAREILVLLLLAGLAASLFVRDEQRRFRSLAWGAGCLAAAGVYAVHASLVVPHLRPAPSDGLLFRGGLANLQAGLMFATDTIAHRPWLPVLLALLGIAGAAAVRDRRQRLTSLLFAGMLGLAFLVVGNEAKNSFTLGVVNYWGAGLTPALYSLLPAAFLLLRGPSRTEPRRGGLEQGMAA